MNNPFDIFSLFHSAWKEIFKESLLSVECRRAHFFAMLSNDLVELRCALIAELETTKDLRVQNALYRIIAKANRGLQELPEFKEYARQNESCEAERQVLVKKKFDGGLTQKEECRLAKLDELLDELSIKMYGF